jgi:hypothetical protein
MHNVLERLMFVLTVSFGLLAMVAALPLRATEDQTSSKFKDPEDGKFDVSGYLDTAYGFLPVLAPITELFLDWAATVLRAGRASITHSSRAAAWLAGAIDLARRCTGLGFVTPWRRPA